MSDPFIGEIRLFGFNFAPTGWAQCNGQLLSIAQNTALFSILGTTYGGDGRTTFGLPNLQGQAPLNTGQGPGLSDRQLGESGGEPSVTLITSEMPPHAHVAAASSTTADQSSPAKPSMGHRRGRARSELLRHGRRRPDEQPGTGGDRWKPAAQQHAALPGAQLLHLPVRRLPAEVLSLT